MKSAVIVLKLSDSSRQKKLRVENLSYFDLNYENKRNEFIINFEHYIYYRDMFL